MSEHFTRKRPYALVAAIFVIALAACGTATARDPIADPDPARFSNEIAVFEKFDRQNSAPKNAILFVGSSSIRLWHSAESFPNMAVINRGFGGSHISDVNHFADRIVVKYKPRAIVFYAGDNDIADGKSPQEVADDFKKFARLVNSKLGGTRLFVLSIKPSPLRWKLWPKANEANQIIAADANNGASFFYIDIATPMLGSNGQPRPELFLKDGLHMNAKGYELWTDILNQELRLVED
jgi:lysophospholipase L1-like esterase